jgi:uncharacterized protein
MEVIRTTPADRPFIQRYRGNGFTVSGTRYDGAIVVLPTGVQPWPDADVISLDAPWLIAHLRGAGATLCLLGSGVRSVQLPPHVRSAFKAAGIGLDAMETGAACRTFNMLSGEGRAVGAALIPL